MFIRSLRHKYVGYGLTTTRAILDHLYITYTNISSADLQENDAVFHTPYDINQPIESLFDRVKNCGDYAVAVNNPYSLEQVIGIAFQIVYQTGLFVDECKAWKRLPTQQKTWTGFKTFFAISHNEGRESQSTTTGAKFHSANFLQEQDTTQLYQQETVNTISNLATATASNRSTVVNLTATNSTLTSSLAACQLQLVEALQDVYKLTTIISDLKKTPVQSHPTPEIVTTSGLMVITLNIPDETAKNLDTGITRTQQKLIKKVYQLEIIPGENGWELTIGKNCKNNSTSHLSPQQFCHR